VTKKLDLLTSDPETLEQVRSFFEQKIWEEIDDPLHPFGRCTCAGEGKCEWCQRLCPECAGGGCDVCKFDGWKAERGGR
jgi:endonuclease III